MTTGQLKHNCLVICFCESLNVLLYLQRQTCEIERLKMEKENLQHEIDNTESFGTEQSHTDHDYMVLQAKHKVS